MSYMFSAAYVFQLLRSSDWIAEQRSNIPSNVVTFCVFNEFIPTMFVRLVHP